MTLTLPGAWEISESDLTIDFVRSSGPGGQNVNKVATKVELRLNVSATRALTLAQKRRLKQRYPGHVTTEGVLIVTSDRFRSQSANRDDALARLGFMLTSIRFPPKRRVPTKPSKAAQRRRVEQKRQRGKLKRQRQGDE